MSRRRSAVYLRTVCRWLCGCVCAVATLTCSVSTAWASHFRYGTASWTVPNPSTAPKVVQFTVTVGLTTAPSFNASTGVTTYPTLAFNYGDSTSATLSGPTYLGPGTDSLNATYHTYEYKVTKTYAGNGPYTAYHQSSARVAGLVNGANGAYRVQSIVALGGSPVNSSGPLSGSAGIVMLQAGGTRTFSWPLNDPDGDTVSCRFGTTAESSLAAGQTVPAVPSGGAVPVLSSTATTCDMSWNLTSATAGQQYVVHLELESTHNTVRSSSAIDVMVQITSSGPPAITGSGVYPANAGVALSIPFSASWSGGTNATVSTVGLPSGATLTPGGTHATPFANTFAWTPAVSDAGTTKVFLVNYKTATTNLVGTGYALINVAACTSVCTGSTPVCDPGTSTCVGCLSDTNCTAPTARCSSGRVCVACTTDAQCGASKWCNGLGASPSCDTTTANGAAIPGGTCTSSLGSRACASGVCDTDNACGLANGTSGCAANTSSTLCRSGSCGGLGTCVVGPPAAVAAWSGSGQSATISGSFGSALSAFVTDSTGGPVSGATVTFTAPSTGASAVLSGATAVTNSSGIATVTGVANTVAGSYSVVASVSGVATPASFTWTNTAGAAASIAVVSGSGQTATLGAAFGSSMVAVVRDASSNPVPSATVTFTAPGSGASASLASSTATTNGSGQASVLPTASGTSGSYAVIASVAGVVTGASFSLTNVAGAPASIAVVSGSGQTAAVGTSFSSALLVVVRDAFSAPVPGATVTFASPGSGASAGLGAAAVTDSSGQTSVSATANTTAGSYSVTASVSGVGTSASFTLGNTPGAAASISASSGSGQSAVVDATYATPLVAHVVDAHGNAVPGVTVGFSAPGSGASSVLGAASATTDSSGNAQVTIQANAVAGGYVVTGAVSGIATPASFSLTNTPGAVTSLVLVSGAGQSATVDAAFTAPLTVGVADTHGNAVSGVTVTFASPVSGASAALGTASAVTNGAGQASTTATANPTAGAYSVSATTAAVATPVSIGLTNTHGAATAISVVGGSGQTAAAAASFAAPLTALVVDLHGNPVAGATVTFAAPSSGALGVLSAPTATTDTAGHASVSATAGLVAGSYAVTASVAGIATPASFALSNTYASAAAIAVSSGSGQSVAVSGAFSAPLVATVVDAYGNAVAGATVTYAVPSSGASGGLSVPSATTDPAGHAGVTVTATTIAGAFSVTASVAGVTTPAMFALTITPGAASTIAIVSGAGQSAIISSAFSASLVVQVEDAYTNAVPGASVAFASPSSGASGALGAPSVTTDASGQASVSITANTVAGAFNVTASVAGVATPASFGLTNTHGSAAAINVVSGSGQSAIVTGAFASPLIVEVVDAHSNPVGSATVAFSTSGSGASGSLSASTASTDVAGRASVSLTANTVAGNHDVTASVSGISAPTVFSLTNTAGAAASIALVSGSSQTATVSNTFAAPLVARVVDAHGNAVPAATVSFVVPSSGASVVLSASSATTDAAGQASVTATANTVAGGFDVTASTSGVVSPVLFALSNSAGAAAAVRVVSGGGQTTTVLGAFGASLVAGVVDAHGNPVSGVTVSFAAPSSGASGALSAPSATTDSSGQASVTGAANTVAGTYDVTASVSGVTSPAAFALTNTHGAAAALSVFSGSGQSATVAAGFGAGLVVAVVDAHANPVAGATVTFGAPSSGASGTLSASSATTDVAGHATVAITANTAAGTYDVTASTAGVTTPATFSLTNTHGAAAAISVVSGNAQSAVIATGFSSPLLAAVVDAHGNPVPGATVTFAAPSSGASGTLSAPSATTDSSGQANVTVSSNTVAGSYDVTASVAGVTTPATFSLTNTHGAAAAISVVSGSGQSATVAAGFGAGLVVAVVDAHANPVAGATVTFGAPSSGASGTLSASSATTDLAGHAAVTVTANTAAGTFDVTASTAGVTTPATFSLTNTHGAAAAISVVSGNAQSAVIATGFSSPLLAAVVDAHGNPVPGATVTFAAPSSGASGTLSAPSATTDSSGQASVTVSSNTVAGSYDVTASVAGVTTPATFSLTNTHGAAAAISVVSGSGQSATVAAGFGTPLVVAVVDAHANPVAGATVTFGAPSSGASGTLSASSATTDLAGHATVTVTANTAAGTFDVTASTAGVTTPATFSLTNTHGAAAAISVVSGNAQSAVVAGPFASALVASVVDAHSNPVLGATITFAAPSSGASGTLSAPSATTDSSGQASVTLSSNTVAGSYDVTASVAGVTTPATFSLTNTHGAAAAISVVSGGGQSATVAAGFGAGLVVAVVDAHANPVAGATVTFGAPSSGASGTLSASSATTDLAGHAAVTVTANTAAGTYDVTASTAGVATPATFSLTNTHGAAAAISVVSGNAQSAVVAGPFASALVASVVDAHSNPVLGATITFAAPSSGASGTLSAPSATTDSSGQASVNVSSNTAAGSYDVTASVAGVTTPATFSLTNTHGAAAAITVVSGSGQSATVAAGFGAPLVVEVVDAHANPVASATVSFAAPSSGASGTLSASSATTDLAGHATVTVTANTAAGTFDVTAATAGVTTPATFSLTNTHGAAAAISVVSGSGQSATVAAGFGAPLVVAVVDAHANPVGGASVTFAAPSSGASGALSAPSATTDFAGQATVTATANTVAGAFDVTANVAGGTTPATFSLTNIHGAAAAISVVSGNAQTAVVATGFASALVASVVDAHGNPVLGALVTFAAPASSASGALSAPSATTDSSGQASVTVSSNTIAGSYDVTASVAGVTSPATFSLTNTHSAAAAISVVSGSGQSATVAVGFGAPLVVSVVDAHANPVAGASVTFAAPSSGASGTLSAPSVTTDLAGHATVTATANTVAGAFDVTASVVGVTPPATFSLTNAHGSAAAISVVSGNAQTAVVATGFASALVASVVDAHGNPVLGALVTFAVPASGASGTLSAASATTDSSGQASVTVSANTVAGSYDVTASVSGATASATFSLTNTHGAAAAISVVSGSGQSATVAAGFSAPLVVAVVDAHANPVAGATVTFAAPSSGASGALSAPSATTDLAGHATVSATANTVAGAFDVTANVAGVTTPATFSLTNTHGAAAAIGVVSGNAQSAVIAGPFASPLVVSVVDAHGNPVPGTTVTFAAPSLGASGVLSAPSATTDTSGQASVTVSSNTVAGPYDVTASVAGVTTPATFSLTNTHGAAAAISVVSGSGQSATVAVGFGAPLVVAVVDAHANPVSGAPVTFAAPSSGASGTLSAASATTDLAGHATVTATANSAAGAYDVIATVAGVATPATFSLTNTHGAAAAISVVSGSGQSATVAAGFSAPLVVAVVDAHANPVAGASVTFAAPTSGASGTLSAPSATTDLAGHATVSATANTAAGTYDVTAVTAGVTTPVTFSLTNTHGAAAAISVVSGNAQTAVVAGAFASPLVASVVDAHGNPVLGATVTFAAPTAGASGALNTPSATTDLAGHATVTATANTVAGVFDVTASVVGVTTPATFSLTNTPGAAATIGVVSGNAQTAVVASGFASPLVASVVDAHGNPVLGATVTFAAPASGASGTLSAASATTGSSGQVSVTVSSNTVAGSYDVTAFISGVTAPATFTLTNTHGAAAAVTVASGSGQSATVEGGFSSPLVVVVVDAHANPVAGATVAFAAPSSGASGTLSAASATTDLAGHATVTATANTVAGAFDVTASAVGVTTPATFSLTNTHGAAAAISVVSGSGQSATVAAGFSSPLVVAVVDAHANPVGGATITFAAPLSGASGKLSALTATSDLAGHATVSATANTAAGTYNVTASTVGVTTPATFSLTNAHGAAAAISVVSGNAQSAVVGGPFASPLVASVVDAHGNLVVGTTVTFASPSLGASGALSAPSATTDTSGQARVTVSSNTVAGIYDVTASVAGVTTPATFSLTNTHGAAAAISVVSGSGQSATVAAGFSAPLVVAVVDAHANPVAGASVTFAAPSSGASGALSAPSALTDLAGRATVTATANTAAGTYDVTASTAGVPTPATFSLSNTHGAAAVISLVSGSGQSATVSNTFAAPLVASVVDAHANPVPGATVSFLVPTSGASGVLTASSATTDSAGHASVTATANTVAGAFDVTAAVSGVTASVTFTLTNAAGVATVIAVVSGSGQSSTVSAAFAAPLLVDVADAHGNPVPGVPVSFASPASGASGLLSAATATTNSNGRASITLTANTVAGSYDVVASASGVGSRATFALTNNPGTATSLAVVGGAGQTATVAIPFATPLTARALDAHNNPVPGTTVTFSAPAAGPSASLSSSTAVTDATGLATITTTANTLAGAYDVTAMLPGSTSPVTFPLTNAAGQPATIAVLAGSGQATTVGNSFATALSVSVMDSHANPVRNASVLFAIPGSGASGSLSASAATTDGSGRAAVTLIANTIAGPYQVTATVGGVSAPATFSLTNTPDAAASIAAVSGNDQTAGVASAFGGPLVVRVLDAHNNPVPGAAVAFAAPDSGASGLLSAPTVTSDATGRASITVAANTVSGTYQVIAAVSSVPAPATFALTNLAGTPASITAVSGGGQKATAASAFGAPLKVSVLDVHGNRVSGTGVTFSVPGAGASGTLSASVATTDASGQASVTLTANNVSGSYEVSARVPGASSPATFAVTNTHGTPSSIRVEGGSGQNTAVTSTFATPLTVTVVDTYANPVDLVVLSFTVPSSGASASLNATSVTTDTQGRASVNAVANEKAGSFTVTVSASGLAPVQFDLTNDRGPAAVMAIESGNGQTSTVGATFPGPLVVVVHDAHGNAIPGATVTYSPSLSDASGVLASATATTDSGGRASVDLRANLVAGKYTVTASVEGVSSPAMFELTNVAGTVATLSVQSGAHQSASVMTPFADAIAVIVKDAAGNAVSDAAVTFSVPTSGATASLASQRVATGADGVASTLLTANTLTGTFQVRADVQGVATPALIDLTNVAGPPATIQAKVANVIRSAAPHTEFQPLTIVVTDRYNNLVPDVTVSFTAPTSGATADLQAAQVTTDAQGEASAVATAGPVAGTYIVRAQAPGVASPADFSLTNLQGPPAFILVESGGGASATVDTPFDSPLVATVRDADGYPVPQVPVTFQGPAGLYVRLTAVTVLTDADGHVSVQATAGTLAGAYQVTATATGTQSPALFSLTNRAGGAASLVAAPNSSPQSARVGTRFTNPLALTVTDSFGNVVAGATVAFSAPAEGATGNLERGSSTTDPNGQVSVNIDAGTTAGPFEAVAKVEGVAQPLIFDLRSLTGPPTTLSVESGGGQSTVVAAGIEKPLVVVVRDAYGNPVADATVHFSAPTDGATILFAHSDIVSDASGLAPITGAASTVAGQFTVTASLDGAASPALFALVNLAAAASVLTPSPESTPQAATVNTAFALPLRVLVTDPYGNAISGAVVHFAVADAEPRGTLSSDQATTDARGNAEITATASSTPGAYLVHTNVDGVTQVIDFVLVNISAKPSTITVVRGQSQHALAGAPFAEPVVVSVHDGFGNPAMSVPISLSAPTKGASAIATTPTVETDSLGQAQFNLIANDQVGTFDLEVSIPNGVAPAIVSLAVDAVPTTTVFQTSSHEITANMPLGLTASVTSMSRKVEGVIRFVSGVREVGRGTLQNGQVTGTAVPLIPGTYLVNAVFDAQGPYGASASAPVTVVIHQDTGVMAGNGCSTSPHRGRAPHSGELALLAMALAALMRGRRSPRRSVRAAVVAGLAALSVASPSIAQSAEGIAIGRLHSAPAGSDWFVLDSVAIAGHLRPAARVVFDWADHPFSIYNQDGSRRSTPVRRQVLLHASGSVVLFNYLRIAVALPVSPYQDGSAAVFNGYRLGPPKGGIGDLSIAADARFTGSHNDPISASAGLAISAPTGSQAQFLSDGVLGVEPRLAAAGTLGKLVYAARLGWQLHGHTEMAGIGYGTEIRLGTAFGAQLLGGRLLVGPELVSAIPASRGGTTASELILGAHYALGRDVQIGGGAGVGLNSALGSPNARGILSVDWMPRDPLVYAAPSPKVPKDPEPSAESSTSTFQNTEPKESDESSPGLEKDSTSDKDREEAPTTPSSPEPDTTDAPPVIKPAGTPPVSKPADAPPVSKPTETPPANSPSIPQIK